MKTPLDKQVYVGLIEILKDHRLYYNSPIGVEYDGFTEDGQKAVMEFITIMAPHMIKHYKQDLNKIAKEMVINGILE